MLCAALLWDGAAPASGAAAGPESEPPIRFPVVFFPPRPPIYGAKVDPQPAGTSRIYFGRRLLAPDGLADFAGEMFYPPLSTRLYSLALNRILEARIQAYRSRRNTLVNALLDRFTQLHDAPPADHATDLRVFAREQTPSIVALENEADTLRRDLVRGSLFGSVDWNAQRRWYLDTFPPARDWANLEAEFQVVRATAHYQDGLTPGQRGLLGELATDLEFTARRARGEPTPRHESDAMFFSPEQTRLRLPADLPPAILALIATYNARKAELKAGLRALIHEQEKASAARRSAAFGRFAEAQWPQLASLETLADEIRLELVGRFEPAPPKRPPAIPSWLVDDIQAYNEDRDSYFGELRQEILLALALVPRPPRGDDSDQQIQREQDFLSQQTEARRQATLDFERRHQGRFAVLEQRYKAIKAALEVIAQSAVDEKTGRRLDVAALLRQHGATVAEFDGFGRAIAIYGNYRLAMLQPGLSPEQRRLLFRHALAGLAQPLPYGELLPPRTAKYPLPR